MATAGTAYYAGDHATGLRLREGLSATVRICADSQGTERDLWCEFANASVVVLHGVFAAVCDLRRIDGSDSRCAAVVRAHGDDWGAGLGGSDARSRGTELLL